MNEERPPLTDEQLKEIADKINDPSYISHAIDTIAEQVANDYIKEKYPDKDYQEININELHN